jgi:diguanylate cyclase (GGDEF)-like protein
LRTDRSARVLLAATLVVGIAAMLYFQTAEALRSAERRLGFAPEEGNGAILVDALNPGQPAERAGLRVGDRILAVDGIRMSRVSDYDQAADGYRPGKPVRLRVERGGRILELTALPGVPLDWRRVLINVVTTFCFLGLGLVALLQRERDIRGRLLLLFSVAVAIELALPIHAIGDLWVALIALTGFYLVTGFQIGAELHLASLIPDRHAWVRRRPWVVPVYYVVGLGLGTLTAVTFLAEHGFGWNLFPWSSTAIEGLLLDIGLPIWALAVTLLLGAQAFRYPEPRGRQQAALVLAGVIPWLLWVLAMSGLERVGQVMPPWLTELESLILVLYPIAVFAAIFRYHLFDIELVVRRGLVYTLLTGALILVFYAALGAGGALVSRFLEGEGSVWVVSAATLLSGLLFSPLRGFLHRQIDRRFFPERYALRQRLIALAGELPALGKLPRMGEHLVARLCRIFGARSATILIANPGTGVLSALASSRAWTQEELDRALFLSVQDPAIEQLRRAQRPLPLTPAIVGRASVLAQWPQADAALGVPLLNQEVLIGVLIVGEKEDGGGRYPAEELELLNLVSHHVATVFENARLFESATYESLTGLLRREAILEQLERELDRAARYHRPLTVAMADLDHFKEVNDRYGHLAGDALLKRVAQVAATGLRSTDSIGRYGGEEFLVVLPETDISGASAVAEKIRSLVQRASVPMEDGSLAQVTISIGLATLRDLGPRESRVTPRDLIAAADRSLYEAKNGGRNRVHPLVAVA